MIHLGRVQSMDAKETEWTLPIIGSTAMNIISSCGNVPVSKIGHISCLVRHVPDVEKTMQIKIGNKHELSNFGPSSGRTDFQTAYVEKIAADPNTDFFCMNPMCDEPHKIRPYRGPFMLTFYTVDGRINFHWIGQRRVLKKDSL